ncbi:MAG TPA: 3-deoxy-D-manno-octulosonic acid transferase [Candidatus Omnitrophota bacterium]|nr:3-deoxy-D-manno-octulosonic acid transferase [Candidatus Omnitrophota bacterium]HPT38692.1 3-deoxy-D-manno-octulosonic acid transferase [Candidatus Omnitrophota bacterium]
MFIIYDLIFFICAVFYLPQYFVRGKINSGFARRLGSLPEGLNLERPIWIHAVSVGEVNAVKGLVAQLRQAYPSKKLVISTVTATGNKIARSLIQEGDFLTYLPLDFSFIVKRVLKKINPCVLIIAETEIWPNLITCLNRLQIPVITVNGRISDSSYGGYRLIKFFIRPILSMVKQFCVQSDRDALRLVNLGVLKQKIQVTGNVKFDIKIEAYPPDQVLTYRLGLWLEPLDKLLVCGSTHPGEEALIITAYQELRLVFPRLKLLIAPRHPERKDQVSRLIKNKGFTPVLISGIAQVCPACVNNPVFILDTVGDLCNYYSAADIVFIGGSLVKQGGHNILEPASQKKPVIFGPYMFNFRDISELFLANQAALVANDSQELAEGVKQLLSSELLAKDLVERAYNLILKNRGATSKNIGIIKQLIQ